MTATTAGLAREARPDRSSAQAAWLARQYDLHSTAWLTANRAAERTGQRRQPCVLCLETCPPGQLDGNGQCAECTDAAEGTWGF